MAIVSKLDTPEGSLRRLQLSSPATLEPIGEIEVLPPDGVRAALEAARKAQPAWAALSFEERARYMRRALDLLLEKQDEFIDVILSETPKTRNEALMMDIYAGCDSLHFYAKETAKLLRPEKEAAPRAGGDREEAPGRLQAPRRRGRDQPLERALHPLPQPHRAGADGRQRRAPEALVVHGLLRWARRGSSSRPPACPRACSPCCRVTARPGQALLEVGVDKISFTGKRGDGPPRRHDLRGALHPLHPRAGRQEPAHRLRRREPRQRGGRRHRGQLLQRGPVLRRHRARLRRGGGRGRVHREGGRARVPAAPGSRGRVRRGRHLLAQPARDRRGARRGRRRQGRDACSSAAGATRN